MAGEKRDLVVTRVFDARPSSGSGRHEPEEVKRWWGPHGFTAPVAKMDVRQGGTSLVGMQSPEGQVMYNTWAYEEIVPMKLLVYIVRFADEEGNAVDPVAQGLPAEMPKEVRNEVVFTDVGGRTEITVTEFDWTVGQMMEMSKLGLEQTFDKMAALLGPSTE